MSETREMHDCEVVVVNYNAGALLIDCVGSVLAAGAHRVIVVDNASSDSSIEALLGRFGKADRLIVIRNKTNRGFAAACNIGAKATTASAVLFLNPDSVLGEQALGKMLKVLNSARDIGMVGGFVCNPDGSEQPGGRRVFPTPRRAFVRAFGLSRFARHFPGVFADFLLHRDAVPVVPVTVEAISGACMLVKREALNVVGLWDEGYFLHCEDLDWCIRFKQKGFKVMFVPDAKVIHVWGACSRNRPFFVEWHKHHGMLRFYRKFFRRQYPGPLWGLVVVGVWLRFSLVSSYYAGRMIIDKAGARRG